MYAFLRGAHLVPFFCPLVNESGKVHLVEIGDVACLDDLCVKSADSKPSSAYCLGQIDTASCTPTAARLPHARYHTVSHMKEHRVISLTRVEVELASLAALAAVAAVVLAVLFFNGTV